ncbi:MAG TPA: hypothetical protein VHV77_00200, partial [Pirellulales bacterium]|nr:hypothetical protein [Pirellulales bacterium]
GYAIWGNNGETPFATLDAVMTKGLAYYKRKGLVDETPLRFELESAKAVDTPLRYPGKVVADEASGRLFIADSNHNRIVVAKLDGTLLDVIGNGQVGATDGDYTTATFNHPQGMAANGQTLYVADTENHLLRKVDLDKKSVKTIAGRGIQARPTMHDLREAAQHRKPLLSALNSPWDLLIHDKSLYIAMAGPHQIWRMPLDESEITVYAGNGREDIVDGPLLAPVPYEDGFASFAQPSGLTTDGTSLFVADSEGSSIRSLPFFGHKGKVTTILGTAHLRAARLFTFGDTDGQGDRVQFQHPLGVAWYEGKLYVADTYNSRIKQVDVAAETSTTIAGTRQAGSQDAADGLGAGFDEPAGISAAFGKLYVADTNNHRIRTVDVAKPHAVATLDIRGLEPLQQTAPEPTPQPPLHVTKVPAVTLRPERGAIRLNVSVELPAGWKINPIAPMRYKVEPLAEPGVVERSALGNFVKLEKPAAQFEFRVPVTSQAGEDRIRVTLQYYYCQESNEGLCKASSISWEVPIQLSNNGPSDLASLTVKAP